MLAEDVKFGGQLFIKRSVLFEGMRSALDKPGMSLRIECLRFQQFRRRSVQWKCLRLYWSVFFIQRSLRRYWE